MPEGSSGCYGGGRGIEKKHWSSATLGEVIKIICRWGVICTGAPNAKKKGRFGEVGRNQH